MVHYRPFLNSDPPRLFEIYLKSGLGRGLSRPASLQSVEITSYALPYFDRSGLIVAEDEGEPIGFIHAGFGFSDDLNELDHSKGIIAAVIVDQAHRRRGIATELVRRAEDYLTQQGAQSIQAGQSPHLDPYYFGIYGGTRPSGFLKSHPLADSLFTSLGYQQKEIIHILQRPLAKKFATSMQLINIKRQTEIVITEKPRSQTLWWFTHFGNVESMQFHMLDKKSGEEIALVTVIGLDHYIAAWGMRAIGLVDLFVKEEYRGNLYGQALITETLRRLKSELISIAECHVPASNPAARRTALATGFDEIDQGLVYEKTFEAKLG